MSVNKFRNVNMTRGDHKDTRLIDADALGAMCTWLTGDVDLLHFWIDENSIYFVTKNDNFLRFLRCFSVGSAWHVALDNKVKLDVC